MEPVTLVILDGWGYSPNQRGNAIKLAKTPNYDRLLQNFPSNLLQASGTYVGLPPGLMGNSEVGHLTIGSGRVIIQKLSQISKTIADGTFFANPALSSAAQKATKPGAALHVLGLLSDGCVHASPDHLDGIIELAKRNKVSELIVHPILDGRDTPPKSARRFLKDLATKLAGCGKIGVVCGRYYAMDRDNRWERIEKYWRALVLNEGQQTESALKVIDEAYAEGASDEFVLPAIVTPRPITDGDSVICFNFRPDRVREISRALTQADFTGFARAKSPTIYYVCLTEYDETLHLPVAFDHSQLSSQDIEMTLPELVSLNHLKQFHTAETEKYAHVTYFLNGGKEQACPCEERKLIASLQVATYDLAPSMQTPTICASACQAIAAGQYGLIVLNLANPDMVGHTGILEAAIAAVESVDSALGELTAATEKANGALFITADHGNCEQMIDLATGEPHTAHTTNPVPAVVADFRRFTKVAGNHRVKLNSGSLADVAPTVLSLMRLDKPAVMTGVSLLCHG